MKTIRKKIRKWLLVAAIAVSGTLFFSFTDNYFEVSKNLDIFYTLFRELNIYYVDETKPGDLMKKGIDSMLESLDPYTNYIPESEIEDYKYMFTGQYGGIGALIRQKGDYVVISEPYEGFPAHRADLRAGDVILEINGINAKGKKTDDISKILKGQPGTEIKLLIEREGEKKPIEKSVSREEIKIKSVPYYGMISSETGYIKLTGFTDKASQEVKEAYLEMKKSGTMKSLILDLRGNTGGLLNEAVEIVNLFVSKGLEVVHTRGRIKEWDRSHKAINDPIDLTIPIAILVDRSSASASEIVAGSIQDLDRGVIIGQRTFGKGLVQQTRPLTYNSQMKITVAKYYIPSGRCIQALDYGHRNEDGSVEKVPDSLISAFKTKNGRIVYDGAGIAPDVLLEAKKYSNIANSLSAKSLIFDYATKYRSTHPEIQPAKSFFLNETDYNEFIAFISGKDYDYSTRSEKALEDLKKNAESEKYFEAIKEDYEMLKKKISHDKKDDLNKYRDEVSELLETEIASRYYFQKGRLEAYIKKDKEIQEAVAVLSDKAKYDSILTTITKPTRPFFKEKGGEK